MLSQLSSVFNIMSNGMIKAITNWVDSIVSLAAIR